jgi:hypothetical protein
MHDPLSPLQSVVRPIAPGLGFDFRRRITYDEYEGFSLTQPQWNIKDFI